MIWNEFKELDRKMRYSLQRVIVRHDVRYDIKCGSPTAVPVVPGLYAAMGCASNEKLMLFVELARCQGRCVGN